MSGPFAAATTDSSKEFQSFKPIPPDIILYGVIGDSKFKEYTKSANAKNNPGRKGQIWNLTFQVLGGEYANQKIFDGIFMDIEWSESMGQYSCMAYGPITKGVKLLDALGYDVQQTPSGELTTNWLPPNEEFFKQLMGGVGVYKKNPMLGTLIGIKTGLRNRVKREKVDGEWVGVIGSDGKPVSEKVTTIADIFPAPPAICVELAAEVAEYHKKLVAEDAVSGLSDDDIPF